MHFEPTESQNDLVRRTLALARELNDDVVEREAAGRFGADQWRRIGRFGLLGAAVPAADGGWGLDRLTTALVFEAFGRGCRDGGLGMSAGAHAFACTAPLARYGGHELRARWLRGLASGEHVGALAVTEPEAGSDTSAIQAHAVRTAGGYRLRARKVFVTNAPIADVFIVVAATAPDDGVLGLSGFAVERDRAGVHVGAPVRLIGLSTSPIADVEIDCELPVSNRLGGEGHGHLVFDAAMEWERTCLFAFWLGTLGRQLDETVAFARRRRQFGRPIGANQAISHRVVDMKLRLETARLLLYRACWTADAGRTATLDISLAKLAISEAAVQSSIDAIRIHGAAGTVRGAGTESVLRDAVPGTIYSGTSDMHREIVARLLGLPSSRSPSAFTRGAADTAMAGTAIPAAESR
jgi:alkylation response protein AidB-like acyl-CoA dehydrogenase